MNNQSDFDSAWDIAVRNNERSFEQHMKKQTLKMEGHDPFLRNPTPRAADSAQHTPGPWRSEKWIGEYRILRPSPKGMPSELSIRLATLEVARVPADHSDANDDGHGNARLML